MAVERQELHCHACNRYVQFDVDLALNGNHVLHCPNCDHEHCRVVESGRITGVRWDTRNNGNSGAYSALTHYISAATTASTQISTFSNYLNAAQGTAATCGGTFLYQSWMNTASAS